jgi:DNA-binding CsgD family transcriptional regulator
MTTGREPPAAKAPIPFIGAIMYKGTQKKRTEDVFGIANEVRPDSYVDRGDLDATFARLLARTTHIALRGESKCGKSWLRQAALPQALVVQCRFGKTVVDLYRDALAELGVRIEIQTQAGSSLVGRATFEGDVGLSLLAKIRGGGSLERKTDSGRTTAPVGQDFTDLRFVADVILASGRRLVVEDLHYMSLEERMKFAFDLKALWDFGLFVVIVGVWSEQNMLLHLNSDLTGRVEELSIVWADRDLDRIFSKGGRALNIEFDRALRHRAIADSFGNAGILQTLILRTLDESGIREEQDHFTRVGDIGALQNAAMHYADQLNARYQEFAKRVSNGIRRRADPTGIYPHAMAVILEAPDESLIKGVNVDEIYRLANSRQPRIQKSNLKAVLRNWERLQVDSEGRGLVLSYNDSNGDVTVVDRQLLLYRKYTTVRWPWEDLIQEAERIGEPAFEPRELTQRERELIPLLATDRTVSEIADEFGVSVNTIKSQMRSLMRKLGVSSRRQLIRVAVDLGLIQRSKEITMWLKSLD